MNAPTALSAKASSVCLAHYVECGKKNGCGKCPIVNACHAPCGQGWDAFNAHTDAINKAAEAV